ncbi:MAG: L-threonylcarbamoyladenylate synthase [Syntrophales bacterium]|nr:L-threonylcarbamoyladenylate synthase [Syntrophales bacterium]MDD5231760.1 L-threonylcarbamoyladenylate synthase [Syntrophales bacterium]MDD5531966.1 L-threonylcarbamoyladenylate synthase [Syntrophales bacterium]
MMLAINRDNPQMRLIRKAVDMLREGGIIVYPTDTVYGLGCDLFNKKGIEKIYEIKRRSRKKPLSFVCADLKDISHYALVSNFAYKVLRRYLPGPYTFVLEASREVPKILLQKRTAVGIRVPDNLICTTLVRELGNPIINTSAKIAEDEILSDPAEIQKIMKQVDLVIDGGILVSEKSSVISLVDDVPLVLRAGKGDIGDFQ